MYSTVNPAVAKSIMKRMNQEELNTELAFFEVELKKVQEGNYKNMLLRLQEFAKERYEMLRYHSL